MKNLSTKIREFVIFIGNTHTAIDFLFFEKSRMQNEINNLQQQINGLNTKIDFLYKTNAPHFVDDATFKKGLGIE